MSTKIKKTKVVPRANESGLPDHIEEIRTKVNVRKTILENTIETEDPDAFHSMNYDNSFSFEDFKNNFKINILDRKPGESLTFEMIGASAPIANALRRIIISDIPTMAIDKVILYQNTSIIQDEVLCHRLGLIPINADPHLFKYVSEDNNVPNPDNTTVFVLDVKCENDLSQPVTALPKDSYTNSVVYSNQLIWEPQGNQEEQFKDKPIAPVYDDIVVAKLRPGQEISAELHVVKGVGRDHAKWSPAATAFYKQMPHIKFVQQYKGEEADRLKKKCPMNVFDIEDDTAYVKNPYDCTMCRECIRDPVDEKKIKLQRVRDHFIFTIESAGQLTPEVMFRDALIEFKAKLGKLFQELQSSEF